MNGSDQKLKHCEAQNDGVKSIVSAGSKWNLISNKKSNINLLWVSGLLALTCYYFNNVHSTQMLIKELRLIGRIQCVDPLDYGWNKMENDFLTSYIFTCIEKNIVRHCNVDLL